MKKSRLLYIGIFLLMVLFVIVANRVHLVSSISPAASLEVALQAAGDNRSELEKVLRRYRQHAGDSLKYKAACFLIENMPFHVYSEGEQLENYKSYYAWLKLSKGKTAQQVADSVKNLYGPMQPPVRKHDIQDVVLYAKCDISSEDLFRARMVGGVFEYPSR